MNVKTRNRLSTDLKHISILQQHCSKQNNTVKSKIAKFAKGTPHSSIFATILSVPFKHTLHRFKLVSILSLKKGVIDFAPSIAA